MTKRRDRRIFHCIYAKTQHWACKPIYNAGSGGYNGLRAVPSYVNETFDATDPDNYNDKRYKQSYCMGQQYDYLTKQPLYFTDGVTPLIMSMKSRQSMQHVNSTATASESTRSRSARSGRPIRTGSYSVWERPLMMKAECLLRGGDAQGGRRHRERGA